MTVFCGIAPCSLEKVDRRFRGAYSLHRYRPDNEGSKHIWNVGQLLRYITLHSTVSQKTVCHLYVGYVSVQCTAILLIRRPRLHQTCSEQLGAFRMLWCKWTWNCTPARIAHVQYFRLLSFKENVILWRPCFLLSFVFVSACQPVTVFPRSRFEPAGRCSQNLKPTPPPILILQS
jgi:hypothetical protein